jgi:hypothetical protein
MQAIFVASGTGIVAKGEIPAFENVDVAPTIARLLHLSLSDVDGKVLVDIFEGEVGGKNNSGSLCFAAG